MTMTMITMMMMVVVILISNEIRFESDANGIKNILQEEDGMELKKIWTEWEHKSVSENNFNWRNHPRISLEVSLKRFQIIFGFNKV